MEGGPPASSSFEQISMQRLTGVPRPISGDTGVWRGLGLARFQKGYPTTHYAAAAPHNQTLPIYMLILPCSPTLDKDY
jgi:hypothetical protein